MDGFVIYYTGTQRNEAVKQNDPLAQKVEHLTFNQGVRSSTLRWITSESINKVPKNYYFLGILIFVNFI